MKNIYKLSLCGALSVLAMTGCEKDPAGQGTETPDATFKVAIVEKNSDSATAAVTSSSKSEDATWYCFCTEDLTSPVEGIIEAEVASLGESLASSLKYGNRSVTLTGLAPKTEYRAIVTGLLADGTVYGAPAEKNFTTARQDGMLEENKDWRLYYGGRTMDENVNIYDMMCVEAAPGSQDTYFTMIAGKDYYDQTYGNDIEKFLKSAVAEYQALIDSYQGQVSWKNVLITGSTEDSYGFQMPGDYYLIACGANDKGEVTGLWAKAEINIPEVKASADYNKFTGVWQFNDSEGKACPLFLLPAFGDQDPMMKDGYGIYVISGWQGYDDQNGAHFPDITVMYNPETKSLDVEGYNMGQAVNTQYGPGSLAILGTYKVGDKPYVIDGTIANLAIDGENISLSGAEGVDGNNKQYTIDGMEYCVILQDGRVLSYENTNPVFPVTLTPVTDESSLMARSVATPAVAKSFAAEGYKKLGTFGMMSDKFVKVSVR